MLFGAASELVAELASRVIDSQELGFLGGRIRSGRTIRWWRGQRDDETLVHAVDGYKATCSASYCSLFTLAKYTCDV